MLISSANAIAVAVAALGTPTAPDFGAWLADLNQVSVEQPAPSAIHSARRAVKAWDQITSEPLLVQTLLLPVGGNAVATPTGFNISWSIAPAMLELQAFLALGGDWDGEGAPPPDSTSVVTALEFLQAHPTASIWSATLNADGSVSLEADDERGLARELLFRGRDHVAIWSEANSKAEIVSLSSALELT